MSAEKDGSDEDIGCIEAINGLYAYLDGELEDSASIADIERHLAHCRTCCSRVELERALTERIRTAAKSPAPERLQNRLRDLIDKL